MKLIEKLKDRYNVLIIILAIVFLTLSFRLASLTIVHGDELRKISDTKRVKQISITAPRGEIRDRYGRLLAGNKPSFTVQIMKDELNMKDKQKRNDTITKLVKILEEDGVNFIDEFPINLNTFVYKDESSYYESSTTPVEQVVDIIIQNNLTGELLNLNKGYSDELNAIRFFAGKKAVNILENEGFEMPIIIDLDQEGRVAYSYDVNIDIDKWKKENNIPLYMEAKDLLIHFINNDKKNLMKIINDPMASELVYKMLNDKGLISNIKLEAFSFSFDEEYKSIKRNLMKSFTAITMTSHAKDDFINIVLDSSAIYEILNNIFVKTDENEKIVESTIPAKILLEKLEEKQTDMPIIISMDEENNRVSFKYKDDNRKEKFYKEEKINGELTPIEALIHLAKKYDVLEEFITDDNIKTIAQEKVLSIINPKISIANWEYVPVNNKNNWLTKYKIPEEVDAEQAFNLLRENLKISEELSKYEARSTMLIIEQLNKQGYRAYQPINLAYGIRNTTVAKLEENKLELPGIQVSIEPIRYYPMGETAAHILGYLGKISQPKEIENYIENQGYSPNDIIGKTGVEQSFEKYLNGEDGSRQVEVDVLGNTISVIDEKKAVPGNNLYLTIDAELQKITQDSLKQALHEIQRGGEFKSNWGNYNYSESFKNATSGAAVAIDVKTGEVLALANYPAYDPNLFATGISEEDWESLMPENEEDPLAPRPLYNIALQTAVQPGSVFKMVTGLAALEKGIKATKQIHDYGYVELGNKKFGCWIWNDRRGNHGWENLYEAIRDSCNYYFYSVTMGRNPRSGESIGGKVDIEDILRISSDFGLNDKTGIEIMGERVNGVPDTKSKTNNTKAGLRRFLNSNIREYRIEDVELEEKDIKKAIDEIVSWAELEEPLSKREVIRRLSKLGFDGEKKIEGNREDLADIIKYTYLNQSGWKQADTLNISIGQGQNAYTPIQMANYMATLSNGGYRHKVSVISKVDSYDNSKVVYEPERETNRVQLKDYNYLNEVNKGLGMVTSDGTARSIFQRFPIKVAAKTGTAQKEGINPVTGEEYDNFAWFVAYGPYEENNPKATEIAVAVVIFQGGHGGYAGPVAKEIIAQYMGLNDETKGEFILDNKLVR